MAGLILFQSTRPMRGATAEILFVNEFGKFQSTRPMRGATVVVKIDEHRRYISIHAPHAGRDTRTVMLSVP